MLEKLNSLRSNPVTKTATLLALNVAVMVALNVAAVVVVNVAAEKIEEKLIEEN